RLGYPRFRAPSPRLKTPPSAMGPPSRRLPTRRAHRHRSRAEPAPERGVVRFFTASYARGTRGVGPAWCQGVQVSLQTADIAHILMAFAALLLAAHGMGSLFVRFRQPRAIGEVVGGLLLGLTVFGHFAPNAQSWLFPATGATPTVLAAVNELGLLLLLFVTGVEIRRVFHRRAQRTVVSVFLAGMIVPFVAGVAMLQAIDGRSHWGPNGNSTSFLLV